MFRLVVVLLLPLAGIAALVLFSANKIYQYALHSPTFLVKEIEIEGAGKLAREDVLRIAGVHPGMNIFSLHLDQVKKKLESDSAIYAVELSKTLPDTLHISIVPESPVAIVNSGALYYLNAFGKIYDRVRPGDGLKFPLVHLEKAKELEEKTQERLARALELIAWTKSSKMIHSEDLGDILIRRETYDGMAPFEVTIAFPPSAMRRSAAPRYVTVTFGEGDLVKQLARLETVLNELVERKKTPAKIRMELNKKVVVKIAQ